MAEIKFGKYSQAFYGDVVQADVPRSTGLTLVPTNRYSGKPQAQTDLRMYGDKPGSIVNRLYLNGVLANGLINNKLYENGEELSKEQIQAGSNVNYPGIAGELATLGLRTPTGTQGAQFVRDAAAEKKFAEQFRLAARNAVETGQQLGVASSTVNPSGYALDKDYFTAMANASDEEIIARFGGVNKEGVTGSGFGINALTDLNAFPGVDVPGSGTGKYGGTGPAQYIRGNRAITESDILTLGKAVGNATNDQATAAKARQQLQSIFENDSSYVRREQARDALSYGLPGYPGGPEVTGTSTRTRGAGVGAGTGSAGSTGSTGFDEIDFVASDGRMFNTKSAMNQYETNLTKRASRQSAFEELRAEMAAIGLAALVEPLRGLIEQDVSASEFAIKLRDTEEYKKRFIGNQARISKGLRALTPGDYIKVEDAYRQTLRAYGLSQFDNDQYVTKFIENDISPTQLSERVSLAVDRIQNADPLIARTLREYYPSITQQDLVGYILDPSTQLPSIQQKVTTAEIGSAARRQGIEPGVSVASQLAAQGITEAQAQEGYSKIADVLPTAEKLSGLYGKSMETYGLAEGEQDVFNQLASAQRKRKNLIGREIAEFSGQSGVTRGSLGTATGGQY